jgi:hypothetical protein
VPFAQPTYRLIAVAAVTSFVVLFFGGGGLWLECDLLEVEPTGFQRTACDGPIAPIGLLLVLLGPIGTAVLGLLSREYGRSAVPFYALWAVAIVLGFALFVIA